jgi:hypothetical protein
VVWEYLVRIRREMGWKWGDGWRIAADCGEKRMGVMG